VGPGRWFPKESFEGRVLVELGPSDAITALDAVGFTVAVFALALGTILVIRLQLPRLRRR
jgi:hypothetical protein